MNHLRRLPRPPRRWVPEELAFHRTREALDYGRSLLRESVERVEDLVAWLERRREYEACLRETLLLARLDYGDQVADSSRREWLDDLHQDTGASRLELDRRLDLHYLASPARGHLATTLRSAVETPLLVRQRVWRESNLALLERLQQLQLEYIQLLGNFSVGWVGRPASLAELRHQLKSEDPLSRRRAWEARAAGLAGLRPELEDLLDETLALREQVARNADCQDWNGYLALLGRESLPGGELGASAVGGMPWDMLAPCATGDQLAGPSPEQAMLDLQEWLDAFEPAVAGTLRTLRSLRLLDLDDRPGKFEQDFCGWLTERRLPVLRMSAHQLSDDLCRFLRHLHAAHRALHAAEWEDLDPVVELVPEDLRWTAGVSEGLLRERELDPGRARRVRQRLSQMRVLEMESARRLERWAWWVHENPGVPRELRRLQWAHEVAGGGQEGVEAAGVEDTLFLETAFFLPEWGPPSLALVLEEGWRGAL